MFSCFLHFLAGALYGSVHVEYKKERRQHKHQSVLGGILLKIECSGERISGQFLLSWFALLTQKTASNPCETNRLLSEEKDGEVYIRKMKRARRNCINARKHCLLTWVMTVLTGITEAGFIKPLSLQRYFWMDRALMNESLPTITSTRIVLHEKAKLGAINKAIRSTATHQCLTVKINKKLVDEKNSKQGFKNPFARTYIIFLCDLAFRVLFRGTRSLARKPKDK